jgi:hypothetical protein
VLIAGVAAGLTYLSSGDNISAGLIAAGAVFAGAVIWLDTVIAP